MTEENKDENKLLDSFKTYHQTPFGMVNGRMRKRVVRFMSQSAFLSSKVCKT